MKLRKSLELIGKRWNIFVKLSDKKCYVSEIAKELHKSNPQISRELKELEKNGLVEYEQKEGERLKYYHVSDYAKKIFTAVTEVIQSKPEERLEVWQINEFLSVLADQDLGDELRLSYSESFRRICSENPKELISHAGARRLFKKVVADPLHDEVTEDLMRSVSAILPHASHFENGSKWVTNILYPVFVKNLENNNERIRVWAIRMVGKITSFSIEPSVRGEAEKKFLEIWFSKETDPKSKLGDAVRLQLVDLASKRLFEMIRSRAKKHEDKAKAEILLEGLKECLLPR